MESKDLIVIGGGINGAGIAADAAGRGLSVLLLEADDLACATSSASSKLIHGGLRYLEHYEFRLVSEALAEREVLLKMAPHIASPLRFRLPHQPHLRPAWMIRTGLFLYDHLGKRVSLPASHGLRFGSNSVLKPEIVRGFEYSDCWVDDARLVVLNAQEVVRRGGQVRTRTEVTRAQRENGLWLVEARDNLSGETLSWRAKGLVNATGPWVKQFINTGLEQKSPYGIRLIKGSHIVVPKVHDQPQAYILQNEDHRIVFVIPWLDEFSIIGTTDLEFHGDLRHVRIDDEEIAYLLKVYNQHFRKQIGRDDIVWTYSGVRPLCDDESNSPQAITRDYTLSIDDRQGQAPLLSVFGGKLTTYRKLAEHALDKLSGYYPQCGKAWTKTCVLPGGELTGSRDDYAAALRRRFSFLPEPLARRYSHTYGRRSEEILANASRLSELGEHFGHQLYEAELRYLVDQEWVVTQEDALWRRTKLGLWLDEAQRRRVGDWLTQASQAGRPAVRAEGPQVDAHEAARRAPHKDENGADEAHSAS
ncbi:glycerol-3-phosphate dehydrogenase [Affinibrenneria salicis]|uniref:Glycerol-3-phosphate dehydrogenase n=1 Tax=Affinibrenneria salicis TaxID=2590031 RepID=A0A5J5FUK7_9GAMM|nr:glycerol-3-phosphate dehydrogenase [Affinibrenneria salicis]